MWLIQGFYVQRTEGLAIAHAAGEGAVAVVRSALVPYMYAGVIYDNGVGTLVGDMFDLQGPSLMSDVVISETEVRFRKQYLRHLDLGPDRCILHAFDRREENTWIGKWRHPDTQGGAWGPSRCIITEVSEDLFQRDIIDFMRAQRLEFDATAFNLFERGARRDSRLNRI